MLNNDLDVDDLLERVQDDLATNKLEVKKICKEHWKNQRLTMSAEDAAVEVQDSTCHPKTNTCILYVIACAQDKNSCQKSQRGQLPMELNCYKSHWKEKIIYSDKHWIH